MQICTVIRAMDENLACGGTYNGRNFVDCITIGMSACICYCKTMYPIIGNGHCVKHLDFVKS